MANLSSVVMPKWGMEMTEGELSDWHVAVGDTVAAGADIVDVETAKIVNTVTANGKGKVVRLCANTGDVVKVGGLLVVLADGDATDAEIDAFVAASGGSAAPAPAPAEAAPAPAAAAAPAPAPAAASAPAVAKSSLSEGPDDSDVPASVVARRVAKDSNINLNNVTGTGRHGRVSLDDVKAAAAAAGVGLDLPAGREFEAPMGDDSAVKASPVARRLAAELGINLNECRNSGRLGRVSKADVEAVAAKRGKLAASAVTSTAAAVAVAGDDAPEVSALSGMRKVIAQRVHQSKSEVPHFRVNIDVDVSEAMAVRAQLNGMRKDVKISLNDILIKAVGCALQLNPALNARFDGTTLERYSSAHVACAVAIDGGVMMPVVKDVQDKGLAAISNSVRDLATRAKIGRLSGDEMDGGTFAISNLGMFGISSFDAIINQPHVAILAVGTAEERPVVKNGQLAVGLMMSMSVSSDHRVVDGADAAKFMADLKRFMESPASMLG